MHSYSYHLRLELYPSPLRNDTSLRDESKPISIWNPIAESTIFDDLPIHPRRQDTTPPSPSKKRDKQKSTDYLEEYLPTEDRRLLQYNPARLIDCGPGGPAVAEEEENSGTVATPNTKRRKDRSENFPLPGYRAGLGPQKAARDWRFGPIRVESFDGHHSSVMAAGSSQQQQPIPAASLGPNLGGPGTDTKGSFLPLDCKNTEAGWGIVHLYRETHDPEAGTPTSESLNGDDGTILCIPAVPGYLSPVGFLNFVGQKWLGMVSHYRMLMTSTLGTYMVLMKFRDRKAAEVWKKEFDGKGFGPMREEAVCHVTFIKSIKIETPQTQTAASSSKVTALSHITSLKPFPPPTPDLVELPTCTVCLERMDETSGLITIPCQHVFHCTCLQSWRGSGCPVCRATNPTPTSGDPKDPYSHPFGHGVSNICGRCNTTDDLWICLICGNVGCGRYKGGHAKEHWKETAHCFSLELETQHVWDYAGDMWVHRLIRQKGEGKVVEFPSSTEMASRTSGHAGGGGGADMDVVPRAKLDNIGMEYTHLLTSQLESQRLYFEEIVSKAADKAAKASAAAEAASSQAAEAMNKLGLLEKGHATLRDETIPQLERDLERERKRADKSTELARKLGASLQEEKKINEGLMEKVQHVNKEVESLKAINEQLRIEVVEQKEMNNDLTMFISGQEKLKEMEQEGKITQEELDGGEASVPEKKGKGKGKGKGRK